MKSVEKAKTVEDAIARINAGGFFITSMGQLVAGVWSASLRPKGSTTTSYGQDDTCLDALKAAWRSRTKEDAWNRNVEEIKQKQTSKKKSKVARVRLT